MGLEGFTLPKNLNVISLASLEAVLGPPLRGAN